MAGPIRGRRIPVIWFLVPTGQKRAATLLNRFATWMDTYAQRTGHYSEEQEKELVEFRERLSALVR